MHCTGSGVRFSSVLFPFLTQKMHPFWMFFLANPVQFANTIFLSLYMEIVHSIKFVKCSTDLDKGKFQRNLRHGHFLVEPREVQGKNKPTCISIPKNECMYSRKGYIHCECEICQRRTITFVISPCT